MFGIVIVFVVMIWKKLFYKNYFWLRLIWYLYMCIAFSIFVFPINFLLWCSLVMRLHPRLQQVAVFLCLIMIQNHFYFGGTRQYLWRFNKSWKRQLPSSNNLISSLLPWTTSIFLIEWVWFKAKYTNRIRSNEIKNQFIYF